MCCFPPALNGNMPILLIPNSLKATPASQNAILEDKSADDCSITRNIPCNPIRGAASLPLRKLQPVEFAVRLNHRANG